MIFNNKLVELIDRERYNVNNSGTNASLSHPSFQKIKFFTILKLDFQLSKKYHELYEIARVTMKVNREI